MALVEKKQQLKLAMSFLALFVFGVAVGTGGTIYYLVWKIQTTLERGPKELRQVVMDRLDSYLGLSDEQRAQFEPILARMQLKWIRFRKEHRAQLEAIGVEAVTSVRPLLNEKQLAIVNAATERLHRRVAEIDRETELEHPSE